MTHPAIPVSIVADGVDLTRSDMRILMMVTKGLNEVPEVRGEDTVVPSLNGRIPRNRRQDRLVIEAQGWVMGAGASETAQLTDFRGLIESIRDLMNRVQDPYNLSVIDEAGTTHTITARPIDLVVGDMRIPSYREVTCVWESVDAADWGVSGS
jgi:hypothetical protein